MEADARLSALHDRVELGAPVVAGLPVVDVLELQPGDLATVDAVEASTGEAQAVVAYGLVAHVDQADGRQVALEVGGVDAGAAGQAPSLATARPVGEQLFMRADCGSGAVLVRQHLQSP